MANFLGPDPLQGTFFIPGGNTPGAGALLFTYVNLSSTKTTVYKGPTTSTAWTNPIVLDSGGNLPAGAELWIPSGVTITAKYCPANDSDPPASPYRTLDDLSGMNDFNSTDSEWIEGPAPTFVSGTSFTLDGDQTATFTLGRRVKTTNSGGTVYSTITSSVFGALTTITVVNDSGTLDSGLSAVSYGIINPAFTSINDYAINKKATALASAGTVNIWGASGNLVHITGTNTISSFSTAPYPGSVRQVVFDSSLVISSSATLSQRNIPVSPGNYVSLIAETVSTFAITGVPQTLTVLTSTGTSLPYISPYGVTSLYVKMVAGGGGGASMNTTASTPQSEAGTSTSFGAFIVGGGGIATPPFGGIGGHASTGTINIPGAPGGNGGSNGGTAVNLPGGYGGWTPFGVGGAGGSAAAGSNGGGGQLAPANTGGGGGGGSTGTSATARMAGGGGGAGGYSEILITNVATSYTYFIGPGGAGTTSGPVNGLTGSAGSAGKIIVHEFYS